MVGELSCVELLISTRGWCLTSARFFYVCYNSFCQTYISMTFYLPNVLLKFENITFGLIKYLMEFLLISTKHDMLLSPLNTCDIFHENLILLPFFPLHLAISVLSIHRCCSGWRMQEFNHRLGYTGMFSLMLARTQIQNILFSFKIK